MSGVTPNSGWKERIKRDTDSDPIDIFYEAIQAAAVNLTKNTNAENERLKTDNTKLSEEIARLKDELQKKDEELLFMKQLLAVKLGIKLDSPVPTPHCTDSTTAPLTVQQQETNKEESTVALPKILNTERAKKYFRKAIESGYMKATGSKYEWVGVDKLGVNTQLAYFCGIIYNYQYSISGNKGEKFPEEELCKLFGVKYLYKLLTQIYNAKRTQNWRTILDEFFKADN